MRKVFWLVAAVALIADRISKAVVVRLMHPDQSIPVIPGVFHLTFVRNPGAAFGLFANQRLLFLAIAVGVIIAVIYYSRLLEPRQVLLQVALGLQMAGAAGNLVDRATTGLVVDFLDLRIWPVFNVADASIVVGTGLLVLALLRTPQHQRAGEC
ncbi:MAG: signal peptidase II [Bacillota bacterium]|nr:signal peptidase II [Bacillota bacterium]